MNKVLDNGLVALALLASAVYALSSLGPKGLRRRIWTSLAQLAARAPARLRLGVLVRRLNAAAEKASAACGGCGTCGSAGSDAEQKPAPEVRVPFTRIGRRR
jgi:hypothetical protein